MIGFFKQQQQHSITQDPTRWKLSFYSQ